MKLAIMQPYFFPYIGYFQLIQCVDKFVVYDDVNYIKKGWINRNRVLVNGAPALITIPVKNASQNRLINETELASDRGWIPRFLKTLEQAYKKAPLFPAIFPNIEAILLADYANIAELNWATIRFVCNYLDLQTELVPNSGDYANKHLKAQHRILDICLQEQASTYINPIGGMEIYDHTLFEQHQIALYFLKATPTPYNQFGNEFQANLSMLDALMFLDKAALTAKLKEFQLISNK
ncbi:MAG: WbqC family protein [Lewinellaceae bacterium]|nr:WbqC family protein [Saprospiraceae bacterium]MCB9329705.1 WbqC family protein [Lewinellaceae bacterium]